MLRCWAALLLTGWFSGSVLGQSLESLFPDRDHDFGTVPHGPVLTHYFPLHNRTAQPLRIGNVRVSCGCVTAKAAQTILQPGEASVIVVQMDTRRFDGPWVATVYVQFLEPVPQEVALRLQAHSRRDFQIHPDTVNFGRLPLGKGATQQVTLSLYSQQGWTVTHTTSDTAYIVPTVRPVEGNYPGEVRYLLTATLSPDLPIGKWYTDLWVHTNSTQVPRIRVPLMVEVEPDIQASPNRIEWPTATVGQTVQKKLLVRGNQPFRIVRTSALPEGMRLSGQIGSRQRVHVLSLEFTPSTVKDVNKYLRLFTDAVGQPMIDVPIVAKVMPQGG